MLEFLELEPGPLLSQTIDSLSRRQVCLTRPDSEVQSRLDAAGIKYRILPAALEGDVVLLVPRSPLDELVKIVDRLLGPGGCPWDQEQTHSSLKKHLLEEVYEVFEAIDHDSSADLREELGDLLLQPLMHAQMRSRDGDFDSSDVARTISEKLIRRHPHVFGDVSVANSDEVLRNWDAIKRTEKASGSASILDSIPIATPALTRAHAISKRAARVGFEWECIEDVFSKLDEEIAEVREALSGQDATAVEAEIGDLLFTVVNIARWLGLDAEEALRKMLNRFSARFAAMERSSDRPLDDLTATEWDSLWRAAKESNL